MADENKNDDEYYALQRDLDKTYFSGTFTTQFDNLKKKFAHKILDFEQNEFLLKDEKTIGVSYNGKRQLKALFFQDDRQIEKLLIQQFGQGGIPLKNRLKEASFHSSEIENLYLFLKSIKEVDFPHSNRFNIKDNELTKLLLNQEQTFKLIANNLDILQDALNNNITTKDLINFGYRKNQLEIFYKLLYENGYFENYKKEIEIELNKVCTKEGVWQKFFE